MAKIKLSETIHFLPAIDDSPNDATESTLTISVDSATFRPGETICAHVHCSFSAGATNDNSALDYLAVSLEGKITVNDRSVPFVHAAEIGHGRMICSQTSFSQPFSVRIPHDAITSAFGASWKISARAVWQDTRILQAQTNLNIAPVPQT